MSEEVKKIFVVVSLPRTGTKSMCRMAMECGLNPQHAPHVVFERRIVDGFNFFSDTPCFVPSFIERMCSRDDVNVEFIFIEKDHDKIFESWKKVNLYLNYTRMYNKWVDPELFATTPPGEKFDISSYQETFAGNFLNEENYDEVFTNHRNMVMEILNRYNKTPLVYRYEDGWEPFCNFIGCEIPTSEIPHFNKETMFENYKV